MMNFRPHCAFPSVLFISFGQMIIPYSLFQLWWENNRWLNHFPLSSSYHIKCLPNCLRNDLLHPVIVLKEAWQAVGGYFSTYSFFTIILLFKHFTSTPDRGGSQPPTDFTNSPARARGFLFAGTPIILDLKKYTAASFCRRWQKLTEKRRII